MVNKNKPLIDKLKELNRKKEETYFEYFKQTYLDEHGNAVIDVDIGASTNLFSQYSDRKVLNPEIIQYIDDLVFPIPTHIQVVLNFLINSDSDFDQDFFKRALRRHYWVIYKDKDAELKKMTITPIFLLIIGICILILSWALNVINAGFIWSDLVLVASWVFIWESISRFSIGRKEKRIDLLNAGQMVVAEVRFTKKIRKVKKTGNEIVVL